MRDRRPNIKTLLRREKVDALVAAAYYQEPTPNPSGGVSDAGVPVRAEAILALGRLGPTAGRRAVLAGLHDPADSVRCAAVRALHARRDPYALVRALEWLPGEGRSRALALQTVLDLQRLVSPAMLVETLIHRQDEEVLGDDEGALVLALLENDRAETMTEVVGLLVGALGDERGIVIDRSMDLLVLLAPASTDAVVAQLRSGPASAEAACVLGRIGDPGTLDALVEALTHSNGLVRAESAAALAELRDPSAVAPLMRAAQDPEHSVRRQAAMALERVGTAAVIAGVAELLEPMVHEAVRTALANAKPDNDDSAKPSRPAKRRPRAPRSNGNPSQGAKARSRTNAEATPTESASTAPDATAESTAPAASAESFEAGAAAKARSNGKPATTRSAKPGSRSKPASSAQPRSNPSTASPQSAETEPGAGAQSGATTPVTESAAPGPDANPEFPVPPASPPSAAPGSGEHRDRSEEPPPP